MSDLKFYEDVQAVFLGGGLLLFIGSWIQWGFSVALLVAGCVAVLCGMIQGFGGGR